MGEAFDPAIDGCHEWVTSEDSYTKLLCGRSRTSHDYGMNHDFVSRAEFEAAGARGYAHATPKAAQHRNFAPRDMLVRLDKDAVVNPAYVAALLEDVFTHRDGSVAKTTTRVNVFLHNRAQPLVVENATLDDVLARLDVAASDTTDTVLTSQDLRTAESLVGEDIARTDARYPPTNPEVAPL